MGKRGNGEEGSIASSKDGRWGGRHTPAGRPAGVCRPPLLSRLASRSRLLVEAPGRLK
ncbi:MAG: hypothetical protein AVDCRST_MAG01-01-4912 [uncultured Rubrobacteraceae bacterium]|uniref:Uncharacterized protein n=1 Tax=uncultured Rubrobacteraceae bacterium TaxID=349277 RepID=A0A6J4QSF1_9ACTN|nr:MAG: hypothetical protein AVDCRST_MAG01-01-4912 [uncultured Rubrobacteraceae bacterium]